AEAGRVHVGPRDARRALGGVAALAPATADVDRRRAAPALRGDQGLAADLGLRDDAGEKQRARSGGDLPRATHQESAQQVLPAPPRCLDLAQRLAPAVAQLPWGGFLESGV